MPEDDVRADIYGYQRLEAEFSRYRSEFQRTRDDVLAISGEFTNFKSTVQSGMADLRTGISSLGTKLDEKSKTNWPAVALAISMVPAIWLFVTTYTQNAISPTAACVSGSSGFFFAVITGLQGQFVEPPIFPMK